ncbi:DUF1488 family protein [Cohaesibacter celericrescens]
MVLAFPNQTCNIDEDTGTIRFSGYDGVLEIRFTMSSDTIDQLMGGKDGQDISYGQAFERLRSRIQDAAVRNYKRTKKSYYTLGPNSGI